MSQTGGQAQFEIDSFHAFEPGLYRLMVAPLMRGVDSGNPYFRELCRIVSQLERFVPVPLNEVPPASMVREIYRRVISMPAGLLFRPGRFIIKVYPRMVRVFEPGVDFKCVRSERNGRF